MPNGRRFCKHRLYHFTASVTSSTESRVHGRSCPSGSAGPLSSAARPGGVPEIADRELIALCILHFRVPTWVKALQHGTTGEACGHPQDVGRRSRAVDAQQTLRRCHAHRPLRDGCPRSS
jgi:hypothetical protein